MKRFILPALVILLFCGVVAARPLQKERANGIVNAAGMTTGHQLESNTSGVTPVKTTAPGAKTITIKRRHHRHHHKPRKGKANKM